MDLLRVLSVPSRLSPTLGADHILSMLNSYGVRTPQIALNGTIKTLWYFDLFSFSSIHCAIISSSIIICATQLSCFPLISFPPSPNNGRMTKLPLSRSISSRCKHSPPAQHNHTILLDSIEALVGLAHYCSNIYFFKVLIFRRVVAVVVLGGWRPRIASTALELPLQHQQWVFQVLI